MQSLNTDQIQAAKAFNTRARQIFWRGAVPSANPVWDLDDDGVIAWTLDFQREHGLLQDGRLGPSTMICMMALERSGLGGLIIGDEEIPCNDTIVARMFVKNPSLKVVEPKIACFLSMPEMDRETRERVYGGARIRAHFSIDSSRGAKGKSLIIQWADPLKEVGFCPTNESIDYPKMLQCIGIEVENVLLQYQLDMDERRWLRRRGFAKADVAGSLASQPVYHPEQMQALDALMNVLQKHAQIPRIFPVNGPSYDTYCHDASKFKEYNGYLARFHYHQRHNEPGAGFVAQLETLFGKLETTGDEQKQARQIDMPAADYINSSAEEREKLQAQSAPTPCFVPSKDDDPRFNLTQAITMARSGGKQSRAARLIQRYEKSTQD
ncbi:MAG: hypothetical protein WC966_01980 [Bradymonadales bacterium]|jgi:hypothetical protein